MGASNLPKVGVEAIVENVQKFIKDIDSVNKAVADSGKTSADAAKKSGALPDALGDAGKAFDSIQDKIKGFIQQSIPFGNQLSGIVDGLLAIPLPALAAVAAITAVINAFISLGNRGAALQEVGIAFDHITASIGINSQKLLKDLQAASEGTIANFDLIKTASMALIGTNGGLGTALGFELPRLLKIAKAEADATGRSVNELFNNIVEGIKKGTPKLIENTGLIIEQKKAYQDYAKGLGITVAQLSDTDKSMALLTATLHAGQDAIDSLSGSQESNADKLDRLNATITNTIDGLAIAVQPAFGVVLDSVQKVLDIFAQLGTAIAPIFGGIVSIIANVFSTIVDIVTAVVQPIVNVISSIAPYFALAFQTIANIIGGVGKIIGEVVGGIVKFLKDVAKNFFGLDLDNLGPALFNGAAKAFGSFANGILDVANKLIFPAVIGIAQFIADFLIGFSPPKLGPLSVIDKGGENLMKAWLEGISGVSLDPVKQVAQQVSDALGNIGKQSLVQVNARLAQLDKTLLPFQNRLDIIKANFDALNEPAKAALDAIQRETDKLQDQVAQGNPQAIERLKVLDAQREAIQKQVDAQQSLVDGAQIQLGLAQAQQAPERALLTIRQKYLEALAKAQPKEAGGGAEKVPKEKLPKGAAPIDANTGAVGAPIAPTSGLPSVLDLIGGQDKVDAAAKGIQDAFSGALDTSKLTEFGTNTGKLTEQLGRIGSVDIGKKITDKFKGLSDAFDPSVAGSIANVVYQFFNGTQDNPNSIAGILDRVSGVISPIIDNLKANVDTLLRSVFDPTVAGSPASIVVTLTGDASVSGSIASFFANLPQNVSDAASGLAAKIKTDVLDPVAAFLTGTAPGSLGDILNQAVGFFTSLPTRIVDALRTLGATAYSAIAVPIIQAINGLIGGIESGLQTLVDQIAGFVDGINTTLGDAAPQFLKDAAAGLHGTKVKFGRISEQVPAFLQAAATTPAGAKGGLFGEGLFKVGERGPEYLFSGQKFGVLPNELTRVLSSLESIMAQPQPMPIYSGGNSTVNNSNSNFTFNGVQSDNDARRRYNYLRAGMR